MSVRIDAILFTALGVALLAGGPTGCSRNPSSADHPEGTAPQRAAAVSESDRQTLAAARAAIDDKNVDRAQTLLRPLALRDVAEAQALLGTSYSSDLSLFDASAGGAQIKEAQYWLTKAARQGDVLGQTQLGSLMLFWPEKLGLKPGETRDGLDWLEKAAHQGEANAMAVLSMAYRNLEKHRDIGKAEYWQAELDKADARKAASIASSETPAADAGAASAVAEPAGAEQAAAGQVQAIAPAAPIASAAASTADPNVQAPAPQSAGTSTAIQDASEAAQAKQLASVLAAQSTEYAARANAMASQVAAEDPRLVTLDSGNRMITLADGTRITYLADGRAAEIRLPEDVNISYDKIGDAHVTSAAGTVHYLANGRVCHVNTQGVQVRYSPDGSSKAFLLNRPD